MKVLIVDDECFSAEYVRQSLATHGYESTIANSGTEAHRLLTTRPFDIILLDVALPDASGFDLCRWIRQQNQQIGILFVSGHVDVEERLRAFAEGADDFLCKPFHIGELLARVQAVSRRQARPHPSAEPVNPRPLVYDPARGTVTCSDGRVVMLNGIEGRLLALLNERRGSPYTYAGLIQRIWGNVIDQREALSKLERVLRRLQVKMGANEQQIPYIQISPMQQVRLTAPEGMQQVGLNHATG